MRSLLAKINDAHDTAHASYYLFLRHVPDGTRFEALWGALTLFWGQLRK